MNPRVVSASYESPFKLNLLFSNNEKKVFDFSDYLGYPVYQILKDEAVAINVKVFNGTVVWNEEIDFDPDTLYLESKKIS